MELILEKWTTKDIENLINYLENLSDKNYKIFNDKIVNTPSKTIGVRMPQIRQISKQILKGNFMSFLCLDTPKIYELDMIKGLLICKIKDINLSLNFFQNFVSTIDNWAVCDIVCSEYKIVNEHKDFYLNVIKNFCQSDSEFIIRAGVILLMKFYINSHFNIIIDIISTIKNENYYVQMGVAWLLSYMYISNPSPTLNYILTNNIDSKVRKMAFQKIIDSRQVSSEDKIKIKSIRTSLKNK